LWAKRDARSNASNLGLGDNQSRRVQEETVSW
jgi:hypothetical protein